jgi:DNA invertase Pin-like site-specific DNA recombinase
MDQMRSGSIDVVAVLMLDQVSRSTKDALNTLAELAEHSVGFVEVDGYIDTTTVTGKLILKVRELECNRRSALIREGMARAKAEGKRVGQPPAADPEGSGTPAVTMPTEASQT